MLTAVLASLMLACGSKKSGTQEQSVGWEEVGEYYDRDSTIYGICGNGTSMNTLSLLTDNGDTLLLSLFTAKENDHIYGGVNVGDRMAVLTNADTTKAVIVINLSTFMGQWVQPNPMDGTSEMGIYIKDGGVAESINMSTLIYESWRFYNGSLEIVSMRDDGSSFEETTKYQLLYLADDSLAIRDAEGTYEYKRPAPEEDYSDLDISIDEGSEEDFVM